MIERRFGGFVLGPRNVELAQRYLAQLHPVAAFTDVVSGFTALRRETVQMALLDGSDMLYIARRDSDGPILISNAIGKRLPANCTAVGKASLAQLRPDERDLPDPLPALTRGSITDPGRLEAEFAQVASQGYAVDHEEAALGVMCLAVARRTPRGEVYAIAATMLKSRMTPEHERIIVQDLTAAADALFPPGLAAT